MKQLKNSTKSSSQSYRQELGHSLAGPSLEAPQAETEAASKSGPSSKPTGCGESFLLTVGSMFPVAGSRPGATVPPVVLRTYRPALLPTQDGSFLSTRPAEQHPAAAGLWEWLT